MSLLIFCLVNNRNANEKNMCVVIDSYDTIRILYITSRVNKIQ